MRWLPHYMVKRLQRQPLDHIRDVIVAVADHFEPADTAHGEKLDDHAQGQRVDEWVAAYRRVMDPYRDTEGYALTHTYFYPAEQYSPLVIERLAAHCRAGWGEIEVHLHHGTEEPDTPENTRTTIEGFVDRLAAHGCLSRWGDEETPRFAFVHGNWALANVRGGPCCGVDAELAILRDAGCYADFSLPAAPDPSQISKVNSLYESTLPFAARAPQRKGRDLRVGQPPKRFPLIMQGPLALDWDRMRSRPRIENGALTGSDPPTMERFFTWLSCGISVVGRPEWVFMKLHCHGMNVHDKEAIVGESRRLFLERLIHWSRANDVRVHFATCREMTNMALAACDGRDGDPGLYRNYRLRLLATNTP